MLTDATTFFLSFATVFGALAWGLLRLDRHVTALERRLQDMATTVKAREDESGKRA